MKLVGTLTRIGGITGTISGGGSLYGGLTIPHIADSERYRGEYEFTPTGETQIIPTKRKMMSDDIIIDPIPSNYGLITWNGFALTVS